MGCLLEQKAQLPGEENLGAYNLFATPVTAQECVSPKLSAETFGFAATLSWTASTQKAFLTLAGGYSRPASRDGQVLRSKTTEQRHFEECSGCATHAQEEIALVLFTQAQAANFGGMCPQKPFQEAKSQESEMAEAGDFLLACGELRRCVLVEENPSEQRPCPAECETCCTTHNLSGKRQ